MTKRILVIDGDIVAFRCAAANETRSIKVTHKITGQSTSHAHRTAFKEHIKDSFEIDEFEIEDVQTAGEIKFALHAINTTIEALVKTCEATEYEVYMSGKGNFRLDLPLPTRYKSNRESTKPLQLKECREFLQARHKAIVVDGQEADDKLSSRCYEGVQNKVWICQATIDKDALSNAGWVYDWTKMDKPKKITGLGELEIDNKGVLRGWGRAWFYAQWVKGDAVDGFKPCEISGKKFGDMGCYNLFKTCTTDKEYVQAIYSQYKKWYPAVVEYTDWQGVKHTTDAIGLMDLYAACCHMVRFEGDKIDTKNLLNKLGVIL